jgi:hypothetical protein
MATKKIVTEVAPRTVYTSPCGRARVELHGPREYLALVDDQPCGFHAFAFQAEHAAGVALIEALAREAVQAADEAADRDAATEVTTQPVMDRSDQLGRYFSSGGVDIFIADNPNAHEVEPVVFLPDEVEGIPLSVLQHAIPHILAVLADAGFQAACTVLASAPPSAPVEDVERGVIYADAGPVQIGVDSETVLLTLALPLSALKAMRDLCDNPAVARLLRAA